MDEERFEAVNQTLYQLPALSFQLSASSFQLSASSSQLPALSFQLSSLSRPLPARDSQPHDAHKPGNWQVATGN
jgi:hypothetical protein